MKKTIFLFLLIGFLILLWIWGLSFWIGGCTSTVNTEELTTTSLSIVTTTSQSAASSTSINNPTTTTTNLVTTTTIVSNLQGILDPSLNGTGIVTFNGTANNADRGSAIMIDSNNKILVTGMASNGVNADMALWRYDPAGSLDTSFNSTGLVIYSGLGNGYEAGNALTLDLIGKILVVGISSISGESRGIMTIWRYNQNGSLDTSFNLTGIATAGGTGGAIKFTSNNQIYVAGTRGNNVALWRYNLPGTIDLTFNLTGLATWDGPSKLNDGANAMAIDSSGRIVVTGQTFNTSTVDMVLLRFNTDGSLDNSFTTIYSNASGRSIAIDPSSDKIYVCGFTSSQASGTSAKADDMIVWRYNSNGSLDTTFGDQGKLLYTAGNNISSAGNCIIIDNEGKLLITGFTSANLGEPSSMAIWRLNPAGSYITSFGTNGLVTNHSASAGNGACIGNYITQDSSGKIYVTGQSTNSSSNTDMAIWKYQ